MLLNFEHWDFLVLDVFSYHITDTHTQKQQGDQQEKYCLLFHLFKCVISTHNIIHVKQVVAAVEKPQPLAKS